jgi:ribosomal protein L31E
MDDSYSGGAVNEGVQAPVDGEPSKAAREAIKFVDQYLKGCNHEVYGNVQIDWKNRLREKIWDERTNAPPAYRTIEATGLAEVTITLHVRPSDRDRY